jgi:phosphoglycerol transferase MdoB-like AlkP superfamily enzyme
MKNDLIKFYLKNYVYGLLVFTILRLALLFLNKNEITSEISTGIVLEALFIGFRFDTVILCYLLAVLWLIHIIYFVFNKNEIHFKVSKIIFTSLFTIAIFIHFADFPFYSNFKNRLNAAVFNWNDHLDFAFGMIWKDSGFRLFFIFSILAALFHLWVYKRWMRSDKDVKLRPRYFIFLQLCTLIIIFFGMRGRLALKSPIRTGTAYFCAYPFFNQLGLNPVFTLMKSMSEKESKKLKFLDGIIPQDSSIAYLEKYDNENFDSTIFKISGDTMIQPNIVLILMEGMSANYFERYGCKTKLASGLDSIMQHSLVFDNFYSSGTHTFNGVYSSAMSLPCLPETHPMKVTAIPNIENVVKTLKNKNYNTFYFTTHDDQFDNIGGFLTNNGIEKIISEKDYDKKEVKSNLGVPDHIMFQYALKELESWNNKSSKFFATMLTSSNHQPYIFPTDIPLIYQNKDEESRIKEYADYAVTTFIKSAIKTKWGQNTIFIITGDHGKAIDNDFEISMSYHHIPLIIYSPLLNLTPHYFKNLGSQEDILPSIAGLLNLDTKKNLVGRNIFKQQKKYNVSIADDKIAVIDTTNLLVFSKDMEEKFYDIKSKKALPLNEKSKEMKLYGAAYLQAARAIRK